MQTVTRKEIGVGQHRRIVLKPAGRSGRRACGKKKYETRNQKPSHACCSIPAQQVAGDHDLLNLAGPFVDAEDAHVAIEALDPVVGNVAGTAEYLYRAI